MSQHPTPAGGPNQTLLELIYAVRGLAQTLEFMHSDLRRLLEEEGRDRDRELDKIREIVAKNSQALAVMPITISDRLEKLVNRLEKGVDGKVDDVLKDVQGGLSEVRSKLWQYIQTREKERIVEQAEKEATGKQALLHAHEERDITGKIEILKDGNVKVLGQFDWAKIRIAWKVAKWVVVALAAGGGITALVKFIMDLAS